MQISRQKLAKDWHRKLQAIKAKAAEAAGLDLRLACYTVGGPRVGNHAFAMDHAEVVPDTWNVINDQVGHMH